MNELELDKVTTHWCPTCKVWLDVGLDIHVMSVQGVEVTLKGIPILHCPACKTQRLPDHTKHLVKFFVEQANKNGQLKTEIKPTGVLNKRYHFGKVDFLYSALDYDFLPGLKRPLNDGFLTPVYFNASVLSKYSQDPSYTLDLFSDTYGSIIKGDEINIQFGINRSRKIVMWLGDIAELPDKEQFYLRSENVESDHDLCSQFYHAQIECVFADPSLEHRAIHERAELNAKCRAKCGGELYQLHGEIGRVVENLRRPLFWEDKHVAPAAESFNRIMVESLNVNVLRQQLAAHVPPEELKGLKGLKLLERWVEKSLGCNDPKAITLPFFVLYDFRVLTCHLASDDTRDKSLGLINERLGLARENLQLDAVYFALLPKLADSLAAIAALIK